MFFFNRIPFLLPWYLGEQGMVDEAQKALEEAEALKKVAKQFCLYFNCA